MRGNHLRVEMVVTAKHGFGRDLARRDGKSADRDDGQILVLGHLDTVYPIGTLAKMPFRVSGREGLGAGDV